VPAECRGKRYCQDVHPGHWRYLGGHASRATGSAGSGLDTHTGREVKK
jgi:hypothetical protein